MNMKHILVVIALILGGTACEQHPKKIIPEDTMIDILVDMHVADATLKIYNLRHQHTAVNQSFYDSIFVKYGVTDYLFRWNIAFYTYKKEFDMMMDEVITELNKRESEIQKDEREKERDLRKKQEAVSEAEKGEPSDSIPPSRSSFDRVAGKN